MKQHFAWKLISPANHTLQFKQISEVLVPSFSGYIELNSGSSKTWPTPTHQTTPWPG